MSNHSIKFNKNMRMFINILLTFLVLQAQAQIFIPMAFYSGVIWVHNFGTYRAWKDGTYAISCDAYLTSSDKHQYVGDTGNGVYRIQPISFGVPFDVYCDMTNDSGGWMLAAVPRRATAKMSETAGLLDPTVTAATRNSNIWNTTSTVPFQNIRLTNNWPTPTSRNMATFPTSTTLGTLLTTYSTYSQSNIVLSGTAIISTIASTCLVIRGKSRTDAPYNDNADWLFIGFHSRCTAPVSDADNWDTTSGSTQWIIGGKDNGNPMLADTSVGINTSDKHWNYNNTATYDVDTRTMVWIK